MNKKNNLLVRLTTVKLSNDIFEQLDNLAKRIGSNRSNVMRMAIVYYLKEWGGMQ